MSALEFILQTLNRAFAPCFFVQTFFESLFCICEVYFVNVMVILCKLFAVFKLIPLIHVLKCKYSKKAYMTVDKCVDNVDKSVKCTKQTKN